MLTSDKVGIVPRLVNGRPVKYINQLYNKRRAKWYSHLGGRARAAAVSASPPDARGGLVGTCRRRVGGLSNYSWPKASARCASARTRPGSRERTWGDAPTRTL